MKILMLTSVYPYYNAIQSQDASTKVISYFCDQWAKTGHNVRVIHNAHRYPAMVYYIPEGLKELFQAKKGWQIPDRNIMKSETYEYNGIKVSRLPMLKLIPHGDHPKFVINRQIKKIRKLLEEELFHPDVILGHWMSPQIQLISRLKDIYHCKTGLVLHGLDYVDNAKFNFKQYLPGIDHLGCRSYPESENLQEIAGLKERPFVCPSGIPNTYPVQKEQAISKFQSLSKWNFIFVGRLVEYKNIDKILIALAKIDRKMWHLDIVGYGAMEQSLLKQAQSLSISENVTFHGKLSREETQKVMRNSHCFMMISSYEVFGLVYLEAMAAGCITIASRGSGVDGIIKDGENGYLCNPGDVEDLRRICDNIIHLDYKSLCDLAINGLQTAEEYTDEKVAKRYLENVLAE